MLKIKVCGLTDPVNTEEIAGTSPDYMGFIFYPGSKRYVGNKPDPSLFSNISEGIQKTGVFVNEEPSRIIETVDIYRLDLVQLHGDESAGYCNILKESGLIIIKAFEISNNLRFMTLDQYMDVCEYFLFDTKTGSQGGSGVKFDWNKINEYKFNKPFFLGGGIGPEDTSVIKKINHKNLFAVDINSRFELRPGIKDSSKVKEFIDEIKR
jgi:phosphoribosylanthranilate isomerase